MNILSEIKKVDPHSTVYTIAGIQTLLNLSNKKPIYNAVDYATSNGNVYKISEGIFAFDKNYSRFEFANKYRIPSYISLYTVLKENGIVFQPYNAIYAAANRSEKKEIDGQKYVYRKIKDEILLNNLGIEVISGVYIASSERALCDKLYLEKDEYFDNLRQINWDFMQILNDKVYSNNINLTNFIRKHRS